MVCLRWVRFRVLSFLGWLIRCIMLGGMWRYVMWCVVVGFNFLHFVVVFDGVLLTLFW